jgi:hypothetical protein
LVGLVYLTSLDTKKMDRKLRSLIPLVAALMILVCFGGARAAGGEPKERVARKACLSGNLAKGVELLAELYLDTKDPTHIYNQGRCFEQNHSYEDAISRFREYLLKQPDLTESDRAETQKHIDTCQALLDRKTDRPQPGVVVAPPSIPVPPPVAVPQVLATAAPTAEPIIQSPASPPVASKEEGSGLRTAGVVTAVVGGGALVAGLVFNLKANSIARDLAKDRTADKLSSHDSYVTLAWIGYGAGAACVAGGAVLYLLGWRNGNQPSRVAFFPAVGPGVAGVVVAGAL